MAFTPALARRTFLVAAVAASTAVAPAAQQKEPDLFSKKTGWLILVEPPTVTDPPAAGRPRNASPLDLAALGYSEAEYFLDGYANRYETPAGDDARAVQGNLRFRTRILVRRPVDGARFGGTVVVEWLDTSGGSDVDAEWTESHRALTRAGHAWVGVTTQAAGVAALKTADPARYGSLDVSAKGAIPVDSLSYDIFSVSTFAAAGGGTRDVMRGLDVRRLVAAGHGEAAQRLRTYLHAIHPLTEQLYEGVIAHAGVAGFGAVDKVTVFRSVEELSR